MVVARTRRQEALLAGVLKTIVGFALLSDLDGFKWPSKNHGLESASISSQSRMKAMHLPVYALTLTRQPQSALKLCSHPCAIAFIGRGSVAQAHTHTHTHTHTHIYIYIYDQQLRWRFKCCAVLRFKDRSTSLACRRRRISANDRLSLPITATQ
jgi:hypothetical protein